MYELHIIQCCIYQTVQQARDVPLRLFKVLELVELPLE